MGWIVCRFSISLGYLTGMTEREPEARDMMFRQGILGEGKVPIIMSRSTMDVMLTLNNDSDADILYLGNLESGIPVGDSLESIATMPWAVQYVKCSSEIHQECRQNEYAAQCWIERDDFHPSTPQKQKVGGQAKWHPGNRHHQLIGRGIAYIILQGLHEVLTHWNEAEGYVIADEDWHVTSMYGVVRSKVASLTPEQGTCSRYGNQFSTFMCNHPVQGRTEFTPRAYPDLTNIRTLMPPNQLEQINSPPSVVYTSDVFIEYLHPPYGAIDVLNIVEAGDVPFLDNLVPDYTHYYRMPKFETKQHNNKVINPGKGYYLSQNAGFCDGSVDSWCNKGNGNDCLLYSHNDARSGILMDGYCGWMVMNLPSVKVSTSNSRFCFLCRVLFFPFMGVPKNGCVRSLCESCIPKVILSQYNCFPVSPFVPHVHLSLLLH
jgi:hypothetical protein